MPSSRTLETIMARSIPVDGFDRELIARQTRRNLEGMELESVGRVEEAVTLYEQNIAEGFEGDWPYGRLVAHYERLGAHGEAERVLQRGIEVFLVSRRRTVADRRAVVRAFRGRLKLLRKRTS